MKLLISATLFVLLSVLVSTSIAANSTSNETELANLSFYSKDDPSSLAAPKGPCTSDEQCSNALHHEAYCVLDRCICPVGTTFGRKHGHPRCVPWVCAKDDDCDDGLLTTGQVCQNGICGCPDFLRPYRYDCVMYKDNKKKDKKYKNK